MAKGFVTFPNGDPRAYFGRYRKALYRGALNGVEAAGAYCAAQARQNLDDGGKTDRGFLKGSIEHRTIGLADTVIARVVVGAAHGEWVEYGRLGKETSPKGTDPNRSAKAAWPPVDAIRDWVRRHVKTLAIAGRTRSGRARRASDTQVNSVAFLIGRAIYRRGIYPFPFLKPAVQATGFVFRRVVTRAIRDELKRAGL